jgi:glycosyltransferase involved in cell wall biosynthesis
MKRLLVISSYPPSGTIHHESVIGGASYTKNTLLALKKEITTRDELPGITVLAQKIDGHPDISQDEEISVKRIWLRNSLTTFFRLFKEIVIYHKDDKTVLLELELNIFGKSGIFLIMLLPFILSLKLINKKVILVIHEVIFDIAKMAPHINLKSDSFKTSVMNVGLNWFYKILLLLADKAIVFEESLKQRLDKISGKHKKITVIPIAVEEFKIRASKEAAHEKLGISKNKFICLAFGFLAWYKGTDWLANVWGTTSSTSTTSTTGQKGRKARDTHDTFDTRDTHLIIAGGANPNRLDLDYYKKYLQDLEKMCVDKNIDLTGFIPEDKMHLYFEISDIVVFPYRTMMSSSAVLSIAFSYKKPILLSENMRPVFQAKDIKEILGQVRLSEDDLLFPLDDSFTKRIEKLRNSPQLLEKMTLFSSKMKEKRSWKLISKQYYETIF